MGTTPDTPPPDAAEAQARAEQIAADAADVVEPGTALEVIEDPSMRAQPPALAHVPSLKGLDVFRLGEVFARSGMFKDAGDDAKAIVKIVFGAELGVSPMSAMTGIYMVDGKLSVGGQLLAGILKQPRWRDMYRLDVLQFEPTIAEVAIHERDRASGEWVELQPHSVFTIEDAQQAQLLGKHNWKAYPRNMLLWRAVTNAVRLHCPDIVGGAPVYTPDELDVLVDANGELVGDPSAQRPGAPTARAAIPPRAQAHASPRTVEGRATPATQAKTSTGHGSEKPITAAQKRKLWATVDEAGIRADENLIRAFMVWTTGAEHSDRIPAAKFNDLLEAIKDKDYAIEQLMTQAAAGKQPARAIVDRYLPGVDPGPPPPPDTERADPDETDPLPGL